MLRRLLAPPPDAPPVASGDEMRRIYRGWRVRQLYSTFIGYAIFYFVRKNMPVALPLMETGLGISKAQLGIFLTVQDVVYGFSKFANGVLGDRSNARVFLALGLILSALMNVLFGLSSGLYTLGVVWVLNGWFQGMGFPPCARILSHWFSVRERGTMWGLWNTSHMVGAAGIAVLAGAIGQQFGWRGVFIVPALIALVVGALMLERLRDTPGSLGLPPVEVFHGEAAPAAALAPAEDKAAYRRLLREKVFGNKYIWLICVANFFVYAVRIAFLNWLPSFLVQERGATLVFAGTMVAVFEIAGLIGSLAVGWMSDHWFNGRRTPLSAAYMALLAVNVAVLWRLPASGLAVDAALIFGIGFLVYGPQFLVGVTAADIATKRAAGTAIGLTGIFGYASGPITGWGIGWIVDRWGWNGGFLMLTACAVAGAIPFALAWNARATEATPPAETGEPEPAPSSGGAAPAV